MLLIRILRERAAGKDFKKTVDKRGSFCYYYEALRDLEQIDPKGDAGQMLV